MSSEIDKATLIEKFESFINFIENAVSDGSGGYNISISNSKSAVMSEEIALLKSKEIIQESEQPFDDDRSHFILNSFILLKIGYKFYATLREFVEQNTYGIRDKFNTYTIEKHYIYEYRTNIPEVIYEDDEHSQFNNLYTVYALNEVLKYASDDFHPGKNESVREYAFFDKKKVVINSAINFDLIQNISLESRRLIYDLYTELKDHNNNDRKIRLVFFKSAIEKVCEENRNTDMNFILTVLLKLESEYHSNYRAYLNSLDPSKLRIDFEKGTQEFLGKLSGTLTDIHSKIILLPVGAIAVLYQLSQKHPLRNLALATAVIIIAFIIAKFSDTQKSILERLRQSIIDFVALYSAEAKDYSDFTQQINIKKASLLDLSTDVENKIELAKYIAIASSLLVVISAIWSTFHIQIIYLWCFFYQCIYR